MGEHTPGPWRAALRDDWEPLPTESGEEICCLPHFIFDAVNVFAPKRDIEPHYCLLEEFEANAHLIAAAPDMLKALREIMADTADLEPAYSFDLLPETRQLIRAAIAKATGQ